MKKANLFIVVLLVFLFPSFAYASATTSYYIEANVESSGDLYVKELKFLAGTYNGVLTNLRYRNSSLPVFSGIKADFEGSTIYNGTALTDLKVCSVSKKGNEFSLINNCDKEFNLVNYASVGDYGVYSASNNYEGVDLTIYMPSSYNQASLVTYRIKDAVVLHNDVAELAWDFIASSYEEDINNLKIVVNLPSNSEELRVFSHGPLNGENRIVNRSSVELVYDYLYQGNAVDMRVVFDKDLVPNASKKTNINGLSYILEVEKERAEKANQIREEEREKQKQILLMTNIVKGVSWVWLVGLIILVYKTYKNYDKEYKSKFNAEYFRDFPSDYSPSTVSYLMDKRVNENSFGATILDLIRKKVFLLEEINVEEKKLFSTKQKKDYRIIYNENSNVNNISASENQLIKLLIQNIGDGRSVTIGDIEKYSKNYDKAQLFITCYDNWKNTSLIEGKEHNFYEDLSSKKTKRILYSLAMPLLTLFSIFIGLNLGYVYLFNILAIISLIYFSSFTKRTSIGNEEYHKWKALKNYLKDFGRLSEKELPQIQLWERYLVYAMVFGIADKVQETMKFKLQNIDPTNLNDIDFTYLYLSDWHIYNRVSRIANNSISDARRTIASHEIASSSNSSSGGFGGGSSFGGGGFGGGGSGGGRF